MVKLGYGTAVESCKQIAVCDTQEQAMRRISSYLDERKIEFYYLRAWTVNDITTVDYGSWSKFFYIMPVNDKTVSETFKEGSGV